MKFIAEIGSNWDDKDGLLSSIVACKKAGANIFKIQVFTADKLYSKVRAPNIYKKIKGYEIPLDWLPELHDACNEVNMSLWASFFDVENIKKAILDVDGIKIASGDIVNTELLKIAGSLAEDYGIPLAFSTGAAMEDEIGKAIDLLTAYATPKLIAMQCVSDYPAESIDYNLAYAKLYLNFVDRIGLSDHTKDSLTASLAVANDYTYFEKHVKPDDLVRNTPDKSHSRTMAEFAMYVYDINKAKVINGTEKERLLTVGEMKERLWARRGSDGLRPVDSVRE